METTLRPFFLLTLLTACTGTIDDTDAKETSEETGDETGDETGETDTGETDTGEKKACTPITSAENWAWQGQCPQMRTPCDIVVTGCSLAIDYDADGGMTMGMPYAATVSGTTVTFEDGDTVSGCVGTAKSSDLIEGTCDGGCTFTLER